LIGSFPGPSSLPGTYDLLDDAAERNQRIQHGGSQTRPEPDVGTRNAQPSPRGFCLEEQEQVRETGRCDRRHFGDQDESRKRISPARQRMRADGPAYARSREQDELEPNGGTLAPLRIKNRTRQRGGTQTCVAEKVPRQHRAGLGADVNDDNRWASTSSLPRPYLLIAVGRTPKMQFKANASIPKMPVGCAAASASPVGSFRVGGWTVLDFSEDRRGTHIVRYYRKRRRHRNRLETEARMAA
jgi:hypothetical protein